MSTSGSKSKRGAKRAAEDEEEEVEEMVEKLEADGTLRNESSEEEEDEAERSVKKARADLVEKAVKYMGVKEAKEEEDEHEEPVEGDLSLAETFEAELHKNWEAQDPGPVHVAALTEKALKATVKLVNDHLKAFIIRTRDAVHRLAAEGEFRFEANLPLQSLPHCLRAFNQRSYMIGEIRDVFSGFTVTDHPTAISHITLDWEPIEK